MIFEKNRYLDIFSVSEPLLQELCDEARSGGGNFADLFFENTFYSDLLLRDGAVASGGFNIDYGCGIRVLCSEKTGYSYAQSTDRKSLMEAARSASAIGLNAGSPQDWRTSSHRHFGKPNPAADRYRYTEAWSGASVAVFVPYLERLEREIRARESRVVKVIAMLSCQESDILMYNSFGEMKYETRPMGSIVTTVVFSQNGQTETKSVSRSFRQGTEMLTEGLLLEIVQEAVSGVDEAFEARRPKGGKMAVVMGAGASGILLHEAMGHAFEADFNRKGQSVFADMMGRRVCPRGITIVDDATIPGCRGSLNFDDEGVPGQRTAMVEDGILTSFLHDRISASYYGVAPTGNGRRESFRYNPIPRMRTTYMESGTDGSAGDIIGGVSRGIYVDQFSNGQVNIGQGDFTFYVRSGFLIEDGRLTMPVKDVNIIGNGPRALEDIVAVGSDLKISDGTWTCGKEQSVPVSCGIPTVLIKELTVGGGQ